MNILVYDINSNLDRENKKNSKEIICPECKENIRININNYKIKLFNCKNGHNINNILLSEFQNSQYIDESEINCNKCNEINKFKSYNNIFYRCNICKMNLCPLCKSNHENGHNIMDYELKNYICDMHNEKYIAYCKECKRNKCSECLGKEINHKIIFYSKIIIEKEKKMEEIKELRRIIDKMHTEVDNIIYKIKIVMENIEIYYKICNDVINNYDNKNRNYEIIQNINEIINKEINNDINYIIEENNINIKFIKIMEIYNKIKQKENNEENEFYENINKKDKIQDNFNIKIHTKIQIHNNENDNIIPNNIKNEFIKNNNDEIDNKENNNININNKNINNDEILLKYNIVKHKEKIKIFDSDFINNNKDKCKFIYKEKEYELQEYLYIKNRNDKELEIRLNGINITEIAKSFSLLR